MSINDSRGQKKKRNRQRDAVVGDVKKLRAEVREMQKAHKKELKQLKKENKADREEIVDMLSNAATSYRLVIERVYALEQNKKLATNARAGKR